MTIVFYRPTIIFGKTTFMFLKPTKSTGRTVLEARRFCIMAAAAANFFFSAHDFIYAPCANISVQQTNKAGEVYKFGLINKNYVSLESSFGSVECFDTVIDKSPSACYYMEHAFSSSGVVCSRAQSCATDDVAI